MSPDDTPARETTASRRTVLTAAGVIGAGAILPVAAEATDGTSLHDGTAESSGSQAADGTFSTGDAVTATGPDWPQYGVGPGHDAYLPDGVAPVGKPTERWRYSNDRYHDGCAVVGDTVYVGGKSLDAVDLASGAERWSYAPEPTPEYQPPEGDTPEFGTPAVVDGTVYASLGWGPYDAGTPDAVLAAVDAESGEQQWWFDPDGFTAYATPVVAGGTVYTTGQRESDGLTVAFALGTDGSVQWQHAVGGGGYRDPVAVTDGTVYAVSDSGVVALDAATGDEQWTALPDVALTVPPVVGDGRLFVGEANEPGVTVIALDAATGEEHWRTAYSPEYEALSIEAVDADRVYVQMMYSDADVIALDAATGDEAWRTTLQYEPPPEYYTDGCARVGDYLYAGGTCLDPADGSVVWKHGLEVSGAGWWLGAAARGVSVVLGTDVVALEDPTGGDPGGTATTTDSGTTTDDGTTTDGTTTDGTTTGDSDTTTEGGSSGGTGSTPTSTTGSPTTEGGDCEI